MLLLLLLMLLVTSQQEEISSEVGLWQGCNGPEAPLVSATSTLPGFTDPALQLVKLAMMDRA